MKEILSILANDGLFLIEDLGFRFIDSGISDSGGNAQVTLENNNIKIRIINERGQLFLDFGLEINETKKVNWYSVDIVREYITGETVTSLLINGGNLAFLRAHMEAIFNLFSGEEISLRLKNLYELKKKRSKELFG